MWARTIRSSVVVLALGALATGQVAAQTHSAPMTGVATFALTVPSIVRLVVADQGQTPDGAPVIRVVTNDPAIRAAAVGGVSPELLRRASRSDELASRGKGSEGAQQGAETGTLLRFTVVAP